MNQSEVGERYAANIGLVHSLARRGYSRLQGIGAAMPYEDIVQELTIVFVKACALHDEEKGSKFSTYFTRSAYNQLNKIAEGYEEERVHFPTRSVEEADGGDENENPYDTLICDRMNPEEALMAKRHALELREKLSPLAALMVDWLIAPPAFVLDEFIKTGAHSEYAKSVGFNRRTMAEMNIYFVAEMIGLVSDVSHSEINEAKRELRSIAEKGWDYGYAR